MIDLGLSRAEQKALIRTLAGDHLVTASVGILDMEQRYLSTLGGRIVSGQVNIDADADVTRQLQLTFVDESRQMQVDTDEGRPQLRRMVRAYYCVFVEEVINDWVRIPVFQGPITSVSRDGELVTLEALGKEQLILGPVWRSRTYSKGSNRVAVIRSILRDLTGERRMQFPKGWSARTSRVISVKKDSSAWGQVQAVARGMRAQVFYDGRGVARMRKRTVRAAFTFRDGDGGMLLSVPKVSESSQDVINTVHVTGAAPTGKKNPLTFTTTLPESHPYSPQSLGRHGVPRYLPEQIEDDTLRTSGDVEKAARRRLQEILLDEQMVTFDALPMPLLEEGDLFTVDAKGAKVTGRISQMVIPLGHEGRSTIGHLAPAKKRRR